MARDRAISSDFWTWEAVIDCAPMTRLLFLGLQSFADDFGVQPLKPHTIRLQVFPGDQIDNDQLRAMIEELVAQRLVRVYAIEDVEYLEIVDWDQLQRVGRQARRRYPASAEKAANVSEAVEGLPLSGGADDMPQKASSGRPAPSPSEQSTAAEKRREKDAGYDDASWPPFPPDRRVHAPST